MRLSRRGWNNVLIFAVLGMILVFGQTGERLNRGSEAIPREGGILPQQAMLLSLEWDGMTVERVGRGWRSVPGVGLNTEQLDVMMTRWLQAEFDVWQPVRGEYADFRHAVPIKVWLAGEEIPIDLTLYQQEQGYLLQNWQGQLLLLSEAELQLLLPR